MRLPKVLFNHRSDWIETYVDELLLRAVKTTGDERRIFSERARENVKGAVLNELSYRLIGRLDRELFFRFRWITLRRFIKIQNQCAKEYSTEEDEDAIAQFIQEKLKNYDKVVEEQLSEIEEEFYRDYVTMRSEYKSGGYDNGKDGVEKVR